MQRAQQVNNAAYQMVQEGGILEISTEQFDRVMKTNLYAMFWLSKFAVPHMKSGEASHKQQQCIMQVYKVVSCIWVTLWTDR